MLKKKKNNKGFTLIELLVVIAIIGILAVVAVPALFNNINKAKVADLKSDYNAYKSATLAYYTDHNDFPVADGQTKAITDKTGNSANANETYKDLLSSYMDNVPTESPFGTVYSIKNDGGKLILTTTYTKASDEKLKNLIENDSNGVITVGTGGVINMTLMNTTNPVA